MQKKIVIVIFHQLLIKLPFEFSKDEWFNAIVSIESDEIWIYVNNSQLYEEDAIKYYDFGVILNHSLNAWKVDVDEFIRKRSQVWI